MLKKSGAFLLVLLYAVSVYGIAFNLHYCGKLLTSVSINTVPKGCGMAGENKMKCCKDKHFEVKVKDAHQAIANSIIAKPIAFIIPQTAFGYHSITRTFCFLLKPAHNAPPDIPVNNIATFLKFRSILI